MSDLLIHSIMHNSTHNSNTHTSNNNTPTILPPISTIISTQPLLPPLTPPPSHSYNNYNHYNNYQQQQSQSQSQSQSQNQLPTGLVTPPGISKTYSLTESNLSKFETTRNSHGLGLLSSAVLFDEQQQAKQILTKQSNKKTLSSPPPSLTSRSSSVSSFSTPNTPELIHKEHPQSKSSPIIKSKSIKSSSTTSTSTSTSGCNSSNSIQPKRRQRLGPSCDSCRLRKVKCDAEIQIISSSELNENYSHLNLSDLSNGIIQEINLQNDGYVLLFNDEKFIKFKSCKHCRCKLNVSCSFKNGYFKKKRV